MFERRFVCTVRSISFLSAEDKSFSLIILLMTYSDWRDPMWGVIKISLRINLWKDGVSRYLRSSVVRVWSVTTQRIVWIIVLCNVVSRIFVFQSLIKFPFFYVRIKSYRFSTCKHRVAVWTADCIGLMRILVFPLRVSSFRVLRLRCRDRFVTQWSDGSSEFEYICMISVIFLHRLPRENWRDAWTQCI